MKTTQVFKGANVFMSRNLVPPEVFDALLDALKLNGADIFLCCDPSRNGPDDFHVIASPDHEKFENLRAKGCNLLGPQCVLTCAKEKKPFPKQGFTCCLAMDGLKVLASGFQMDEKVQIGKLVTAMGGVLHGKASSDVNFVIVKNVLAAKYKWALNIHKKPIVTLNWLHQCWNEHRVVPQEPYKVLPFSGLTICVTRIPADERKEMEKLISQNGGEYSAELTKSCSHLIAKAAEGDKYKVARKWGHIHIVTRKWFDQSIARKVCLDEESYHVLDGSKSLIKGAYGYLGSQNGQQKVPSHSISINSSVAAESDVSTVPCAQSRASDLEASLSPNVSSMSTNPAACVKEENGEVTKTGPEVETEFDGCVANDSESEDNDLYLSDCRIFLLGFGASEMRRLVNMVRRGGGSRYMLLNDKLTHIIIGTPSETQKRQARSFAASGVIQVVTARWLEDCDRERKETPVHPKHSAHDLILPKGMVDMDQGKNYVRQTVPFDSCPRRINDSAGATPLLSKGREEGLELGRNEEIIVEVNMGSSKQKITLSSLVNYKRKGQQRTQCDSNGQNKQVSKSSVFEGKTLCFSRSFPEDKRAEVVEWVNQGGGEVVDNPVEHNVHFIIECHGVISRSAGTSQATYVSSHWVRSCLADGCLLDVSSHILYSPLPCRTPLPGFQNFRLCVSQYEGKDRLLLRNLCFVLGAKFVEKLTRKVTHLLCKFAVGPKYEAACKWGIVLVTSDWVYECVRQNQVACPDHFYPKEMTTQDQEAGCCLASQFPTQFISMTSGDNRSLHVTQSEDRNDAENPCGKNGCLEDDINGILGGTGRQLSFQSKKARLSIDGHKSDLLPSGENLSSHAQTLNLGEDNVSGNDVERGRVVPDVAAAIEDLLEQTSKIQDQNSPGRISDQTLFLSNSTASEQYTGTPSVTGLSRHWLNRVPKNDNVYSSRGDATSGVYGNFSETQTDSQVVGYEEDLSGRQMLIDRVRTRSSLA